MSLSLIWIGEKSASVKPWLSLIVDVAPEWYMNTYYDKYKDTATPPDDVIILDISEKEKKVTRKDIADVLNLVSQYSPKAVGVDYTFPKSENYDSVKTEYLTQTINNLPQEIPFVFAYDTISSAISDSIMEKHHKGHVNFYGFYDFKFHADGESHIALKMAELAGCDVSLIDTSSFVVNYSQAHSKRSYISIEPPLTSEDTATIARYTPNSIILIGSINNPNDMQKLPYRINGKESYIAGSRIIFSMLTSILSVDAPKTSPLSDKKYHYYKKIPAWFNWFIIIISAIIYLFFYCFMDSILEPLKEMSKWMIIVIGFIKSILSFIFIALNLILYMYITHCSLWIPDVVLLLYMTVFISYSYELFNLEDN